MPNAAKHPGTAWSSKATGAPNTAMIPSPVNLSTVPPYRWTTPAARLTSSVIISRNRSAPNRRCDVHRVHHIGEQHRHLLVLRRSGGRGDGRAALTTKLGRRALLRAAGTTGERRCGQCTATVPNAVHVSIVSPHLK